MVLSLYYPHPNRWVESLRQGLSQGPAARRPSEFRGFVSGDTALLPSPLIKMNS